MWIAFYILVLLLLSAGLMSWYITKTPTDVDAGGEDEQETQEEPEIETEYQEIQWHDRYIVSFRPMSFDNGYTVDAERDVLDIMKQLRRRLKQRQYAPEHQKAISRKQDAMTTAYTTLELGMETYRLALSMHHNDEAMFVLLIQCDTDPTLYGTKLLEDVLNSLQFLPIEEIKTYMPESFEMDLGMGAIDWFNERGEDGSVH